MSGTHSPLAPSSMARTVQCPGSVVMQQRYPEPDGPEAQEGEAAHWVFAEQVERWPESDVAVGEIAPNGVVIDQEMLDGAAMMAEHCFEKTPGQQIEQRVSIAGIHAQCWGTPDARGMVGMNERNWVEISDFKYGHGFVDVFENWQLMCYARGTLDEYGIDGQAEQSTTFMLSIVQPRNYHRDGPIRTWTVPAVELRGYWNRMAAACEEALGPNPSTRAGPECKHCTARHACPTLQAAALDAVDTAGTAVALDLPTDAAAHEKRRLDWAIDQLKARSSGLEQQLLDAMKRGQHVPHFHVEHGAGREVWSKPAAEVLTLGQLYGVDLGKPVEPITPTQARERYGIVTAGFTTRGTGEAKLVADSPYQAMKIFGGHKP